MVKERDDTVRQLTLRMQSTGSDLRSVEDQLQAETQAAGDARSRAERIVLFSLSLSASVDRCAGTEAEAAALRQEVQELRVTAQNIELARADASAWRSGMRSRCARHSLITLCFISLPSHYV